MRVLRELTEELRIVSSGRSRVIDAFIPPIIFLVLNRLFELDTALMGALLVAILILFLRVLRKQSVKFSLGGISGVLLAVLIAKILGREESYFLPGIVTGFIFMLISLISLIVKRPLMAWTSYFARRWTLAWYWHPKVRPAYSEVTTMWLVFFAIRLFIPVDLFTSGSTEALGLTQLITGWPATLLLLVVSYLYGIWRLQQLGGPSVVEYKLGTEPPWVGQKRGF